MISISSHSRFSERLNRIYLISYQVIVILQLYFLTWYRFWGGFLNWEKLNANGESSNIIIVELRDVFLLLAFTPFRPSSVTSSEGVRGLGRVPWNISKACVDARRARELFIIPSVLMTHWGNRVCVCVCDGKVFCQKTLWSVLCYSVEGGHREDIRSETVSEWRQDCSIGPSRIRLE